MKKRVKGFIAILLVLVAFLTIVFANCSQELQIEDRSENFVETIFNYFTKTTIAEPSFSQKSGIYNDEFEVYIENMSDESGVTIKYTMDGTKPGKNNGYIYYSGQTIPITRYRQLKAVAFTDSTDDKFVPSPVVVAEYKMKVLPPVFSFNAEKKKLAISCDTTGAIIYYTDDGSKPTTTSKIYVNEISIITSKTIQAFAYKEGWEYSDYRNQTFSSKSSGGVLTVPSITPESGTYNNSQSVVISTNLVGATIKYKLEESGNEPKTFTYTGAVTVNKNSKINAWIEYDGEKSDEALASYSFKVKKPIISPSAGMYFSSVTGGELTADITCETNLAKIYYYLNEEGSVPPVVPQEYKGAFKITSTGKAITIKAYGSLSGYAESELAEAVYGVVAGENPEKLTTPSITYDSGTKKVSITHTDSSADIKYSVDNQASWISYSIPIDLTQTAVVYAKAAKSGFFDSDVVSEYCLVTLPTAATPKISLSSGTYNPPVSLTIACSTSGAALRYTTDGSEPTASSSVYSGAITLLQSAVVRVKAYKEGYNPSLEATNVYTIQAEPPTISPTNNTFVSEVTVNIYSGTDGADIYYTLDGNDPLPSSILYTGAFTLAKTTTVKAIAVKTGLENSIISQKTFTKTEVVATPTFSPVAGTYATTQSVTIASTTSGATIRYTTDGSTPSKTNGAIYSAPINIAASTELRAIAYKDGMTDSGVKYGAYTIPGTVADPIFNIASGTYPVAQTVTISSQTAGAQIYYTTNGAVPTTASSLYVNPIDASVDMTIKARAYKDGVWSANTATLTLDIVQEQGTGLSFITAKRLMLGETGNNVSLVAGENWFGFEIDTVANAGQYIIDTSTYTPTVYINDLSAAATLTDGKLNCDAETRYYIKVTSASAVSSVIFKVYKAPLAQPVIAVSKTTIACGELDKNITQEQSFTISNAGTGTFNCAVIDNAAWLTLDKTSLTSVGTTPQTVTVTVNTTGLTAGQSYTGKITVTSSTPDIQGSPKEITVTLSVKPEVVSGIKVHLKTTWSTPKIYYWSVVATPAISNATWPGVAMTEEGNGWFGYTFPNATSANIIFSNNGASQTADLSRTTGEWWYKDGVWNSTNPEGPAVPTITVSPAAGNVTQASTTVTITATNSPTSIKYTTDGSDPKTSGISINSGGTAAINIDTIGGSKTLKVWAQNAAGESTGSFAYTRTDPSSNVKIFYKTSSAPTIWVWEDNGIAISSSMGQSWPGNAMTLDAASGWYMMEIPNAVYTLGTKSLKMKFNSGAEITRTSPTMQNWFDGTTWTAAKPVEAPVISANPSTRYFTTETLNVTLSLSGVDSGKYTTDGTTPSETVGTTFSNGTVVTIGSGMVVGNTKTLKLFAKNTAGTTTREYVYEKVTEIPVPDFTWDNANVYFVIPDRFHNGNTANDLSYGRVKTDATGKNIGTFHGGDIAGLTAKLDYLEALGVNAIWITSPYEQTHGWCGGGSNGDFAHYSYHGYYPLDYTAMDKNMGTVAEMRTFVNTAHSKGIRVVMDVVLNHAGYNTLKDMVEYGFGKAKSGSLDVNWTPAGGQTWHSYHDNIDYSDVASWNKWWKGTGGSWVRAGLGDYTAPGGDDLTQNLAGLPDFRTELTSSIGMAQIMITKWGMETTGYTDWIIPSATGLRSASNTSSPTDFVIDALAAWVREFGIDGFRCDTAKHVEKSRWAQLKQECNTALAEWRADTSKPKGTSNAATWTDNFWMTAEVWGHGANKSEYHTVANFDSVINFSFPKDGNLGSIGGTWAGYASSINADPTWNSLHYISSHDTALSRTNIKNLGTALTLSPGGVQIFYGDETARPFGDTGSDPYQGTRSDMNWDANPDVLAHWSKLGQFRKRNLSVGAGSQTDLGNSTYGRSYEAGGFVNKVVIKLGASGSTSVNVAGFFADGDSVKDAYTGTTATVASGSVTFTAGSEGVILIEKVTP
ncbi:MAG TPA: chitobiase/beta-hexosaminidase C-terminal domain-containing protein [Spirochaetota bacterium]|nr:chitobiase/beta-hexosaminidase C-terminal domain-containing protein [Spirochaetota bacterium]HOS32793.1 chitobiase/beta-hexosaminidase C-terminal domain-containing protein [Spirochaetota bacterium]HOS56151.1 chitobiase/beta-hexosaminidase C-terminal domain-containing protein [Spirochaetota bacterium]HPK60882.1 chitobiase/beta-hexosaminidase C-terminal domain-containing protein [Spirochaetota bacterium]HQF78525.1 chitobiase/beta-hexosaminidase C-terminal domain-containing protein [Spirochaeto